MTIKLNQMKSENPAIKLKYAVPGQFYISVHPGAGASGWLNKVGICSRDSGGFNKLQLIDNTDYVANNDWLVQKLESVDINYPV